MPCDANVKIIRPPIGENSVNSQKIEKQLHFLFIESFKIKHISK